MLTSLKIAAPTLLLALSTLGRAQASTASAPKVPPCTSSSTDLGVRWIVNAGALHHSKSVIPLEEELQVFGTPCTFLIAKDKTEPYDKWNSVATITMRSATEIDHCCDPGVAAVLYDPEAWEFTPKPEQQHPDEYACKIAAALHAQHKLLIVAPGTDLIGGGPNRYDRFVQAKIPGAMARCADVYEIQAQGTEMDVAQYQSYVRQASEQARSANPHIVVLAGLSTNPTGKVVTGAQLFAAVKAVSAYVSGYWLNIPGGGAACPTCGQPKPQVAADLLDLMKNAKPHP